MRFPVIRRLLVENYEIFQNESSEGISHAFRRGVHAVVGINGLGKTTLLAIMYRSLLGPFDQSKSDDAGLLGSKHELSAWRNRRYFIDRVNDNAANAIAEVDVSFGNKILTIRRRLNNLKIESLVLDGAQLDPSEEEFQKSVVELSGVATFFDYFAVLRYLVFFLEDRVKLIWDKRSQFDMLRVLLFDTAAAKAAAEAYDEAQATDSRYRNRRAVLGKDRDRLSELEGATGDAQASEFRALQAAIESAETRDREQAAQVEAAIEAVEEARLKRERGMLDLQEARNALEYEEQAHYQHLFPKIDETAKHVFLNLLSGGGCLVCGSNGTDLADHLRQKLDKRQCPVCDSPEERHEKIVTPADFSRARLRKLNAKVESLRVAVNAATRNIDSAEREYEELVRRREEDRVELRSLRRQLNQLGFSELPSESDIENLRVAVREGERELSRLEAERTAAEGRYGRVMKKQKATIEGAVSKIRRGFRDYAGLVLAERCELNVGKERRSIGQEGAKFEFPYFEVMMTSGVFDQSLSNRPNADSVSESQREFLDIAFRLALIEAAVGQGTDSMMVLETPESSLDSLFVAMAGEAFRHYGEVRDRNNVLIATTNLNNEEMLSALLGVRRVPRVERPRKSDPKLRPSGSRKALTAPVVPARERMSRIINLLELAAPNAALRMHRGYYRDLFVKAIDQRGEA